MANDAFEQWAAEANRHDAWELERVRRFHSARERPMESPGGFPPMSPPEWFQAPEDFESDRVRRKRERRGRPPVEPRRAVRDPEPPSLTVDDVRALVAACPPSAPVFLRLRALIWTLAHGLKLSEALALRADDVAAGALLPRLRRPRVVPLIPEARECLERWLVEERPALGLGSGAPIFCTFKGGQLDPGHVRGMLGKLGQARIGKRVHSEALRRVPLSRPAETPLPS